MPLAVVNALAPARQPVDELTVRLQALVFEQNLAVLGEASRQLVEAAAAKGRVSALPDGTRVLTLGSRVLDRPPNGLDVAGEHGVVVVFGFGLGHTLRAARELSPARVVVYEPDPGLLRTVFEQGPLDLGDAEIVCTPAELAEMWARLAQQVSTATLVRSEGYAELYPEPLDQLKTKLAELVQLVNNNTGTHRERSREWIDDMLRNVELLENTAPFQSLMGEFRNVPAFIVGAGPSLAKNIELLRVASRKGLVFAMNSSGRALAAHGIEPQVLACMESIDVSHLIRDLPFIDRVVRAFGLSAHPTALRTGGGPLLPLWESIPELAIPLHALTGLDGIPVCGSVSTAAFSIAELIGCSPIVLVGQDLAYTGGRAYAAGTPYETSRVHVGADGKLNLDWCETLRKTHEASGRDRSADTEQLIPVPAWGGAGDVPSASSFVAVRNWLESAAIKIEREFPDRQLINATEGGAHVGGFADIPLAQVLEGLPDLDIRPEDVAARARSRRRVSGDELKAWARSQAAACQDVAHAALRLRIACRKALAILDSGNAAALTDAFTIIEAAELALRNAGRGAPEVGGWAFRAIHGVLDRHTRSESDARQGAESGLLRECEIAAALDAAARELRSRFRALARAPQSR